MKKRDGRTEWAKGDRAKIARSLGISTQYLCDIMAGRARCSAARAIELERICAELGYNISRTAWVFIEERDPRLFPKK